MEFEIEERPVSLPPAPAFDPRASNQRRRVFVSAPAWSRQDRALAIPEQEPGS